MEKKLWATFFVNGHIEGPRGSTIVTLTCQYIPISLFTKGEFPCFVISYYIIKLNANMNHKAVDRLLVLCSIGLLLTTTSDSFGNLVQAFQPHGLKVSSSIYSSSRRYSSLGGGPPGPSRDDDDDDDDDGLSQFLTPKKESENMKRAREFLSETSLPISFDESDREDDDEMTIEERLQNLNMLEDDGVKDSAISGTTKSSSSTSSSALVGSFGMSTDEGRSLVAGATSADVLAKNPYMQVVSKLTPSELIAKFTSSASPRVQDAVRTTVLGLIGSLPKMAFDTTTMTTGQRLASLMFQLQMTGYMLKNADYRLSLSQSLGVTGEAYNSNLLLSGSSSTEDFDTDVDPLTSGKVKGKIKVRYVRSNLFGTGEKDSASSTVDSSTSSEGSSSTSSSPSEGVEIEVDAAAYMSELRSEVSKLKEELTQRKEAKEEALRKDLLLYIRTLPAQELRSLTNTMSPEVLVCMKGLVQAVLGGIGDGKIGPETVTEQSGEAMAQLCMWQLAVGYNLRELEVREQMKKSLQNILEDSSPELGLYGTLE